MKHRRYILNGHEPVECKDLIEWGMWLNKSSLKVNDTVIGDVHISTVFLGLDHSFGGDVPILFETMVFGGEHNDYQERYATWDEAERGHERAVELVKSSSAPAPL